MRIIQDQEVPLFSCSRLLFSAGLSVAAFVAPVSGWAAYSVTTFDAPGSQLTQLWDITNTGQIVGTSDLGGFVYQGGVFNYLPTYNGLAPSALGMSDGGIVVGGLFDPTSGGEVGYLYQNGTYTTLSIAGATTTEVRHISADGRYAAGYYQSDTATGGFVLDRSTSALTLVPVDPNLGFMILQGANSAGVVTGSFTSYSDEVGGGVLYDVNTGVTTIYPTAAGHSNPRFRDITETGLITGFAGSVSIVGTTAGGFETFAMAGAESTIAEGINEAAIVVGSYTDANGFTHGFVASAVPEPASALLLGIGLAIVGGAARARRRL